MDYLKIEEPKFIYHINFELVSFLGRHFMNNKSKIEITDSPLLLDLGAVSNYIQRWTHVNFYRIRWRFWKSKKTRKPEIQTDLRYPLNCYDNIADGIYSGHTLEHLYPKHAFYLLCEVSRVLKPKCWFRVNVPDLKIFVDFYIVEIDLPEYKYRAEAIGNYTQNWGYHSVWDEKLLS